MLTYVTLDDAGRFAGKGSSFPTKREDVETFFAALASGSEDSLVLHFHGGLVNVAEGVKNADRDTKVYRRAGVVPLSFVWRTGLLETVGTMLSNPSLRHTLPQLERLLLSSYEPRLRQAAAGGALARLTPAALEQELSLAQPFAQLDALLAQPGRAERLVEPGSPVCREALEQELLAELIAKLEADPTLFEELEAGVAAQPSAARLNVLALARLLVVVALAITTRFAERTDHGFHATSVEELLLGLPGLRRAAQAGFEIWGTMKQRAGLMWKPGAAGAEVLQWIGQLQRQRPGFQLHLVGHSAGSIVICELLRAISELNLPVKVHTIVFLAPAGSVELGLTTLVPFADRVQRFRLYTMPDAMERQDPLVCQVPQFYPHSLLYFIAGLLERESPSHTPMPLMGLLRHASGQYPYNTGDPEAWRRFLQADNRLVPTRTVCSHGGFMDVAEIQDALVALLASPAT